jgi:hypothetical protein
MQPKESYKELESKWIDMSIRKNKIWVCDGFGKNENYIKRASSVGNNAK